MIEPPSVSVSAWTYPAVRPTMRSARARIRGVEAPVPAHVTRPRLVAVGPDHEACYLALRPLVVAVHDLDRERPPARDRIAADRAPLVVGIPDRPLPVAGVARRDVDVAQGDPEVARVGVGHRRA